MCDIPGRISQYRGNIWFSAFTTIHVHGVGFGFCQGFFVLLGFLLQTIHEVWLFSPYVICTKSYYERAMFVCTEECFEAGIWNLNFLVASHFLIFLGLGLSRTLLIPIRCFNHVLGFFSLPCRNWCSPFYWKTALLRKMWHPDTQIIQKCQVD